MLSQNTDDEKLSQEIFAFPEPSKTLISQIKLSELLGSLIRKNISLAEQAHVDSTTFRG